MGVEMQAGYKHRFISETIQDRATVTVERLKALACDLVNGPIFITLNKIHKRARC